MVKRTQTICRQQPMNCLSLFDHFVLKGLLPNLVVCLELTFIYFKTATQDL